MYRRYRVLFLAAFLLALRINSFSQEGQDGKDLAKQLIEVAELIMEETQAMDQARETYVQAVAADPDNIVANYRAGDFHMKTVGKDRAVQYFLKVLELDPEFRFDITYWIGRQSVGLLQSVQK